MSLSLSHKQVRNLQHHPDHLVRKLCATALKAMEQRDELAQANRQLQEEKAVVELEKNLVLILADHKGSIEVKAESYLPVKVIPIHESDDRNPATEDDAARERTPLSHRHLWDCKTIAMGHTGLDRYRRTWGEGQLMAVELLTEKPDAAVHRSE